MNKFTGLKWSAQVLSHYIAMFKDITIGVSIWMVRQINLYVAICSCPLVAPLTPSQSPALDGAVFGPALVNHALGLLETVSTYPAYSQHTDSLASDYQYVNA